MAPKVARTQGTTEYPPSGKSVGVSDYDRKRMHDATREVAVRLRRSAREKALLEKRKQRRSQIDEIKDEKHRLDERRGKLHAEMHAVTERLGAAVAPVDRLACLDEINAYLTPEEVDSVVVHAVEIGNVVPTALALLKSQPTPPIDVCGRLLRVLVNASSVDSDVLERQALDNAATEVLLAILANRTDASGEWYSALELRGLAARCLTNLIVGESGEYSRQLLDAGILAHIDNFYHDAAPPAPTPSSSTVSVPKKKTLQTKPAPVNSAILGHLATLLNALSEHLAGDDLLTFPIDFVRGNVQRWINTISSTRSSETKLNLLSVLYGNMSHPDIMRHMSTKPVVCETLVKSICDIREDVGLYARLLAVRVVTRLARYDRTADQTFEVAERLVELGVLTAILPYLVVRGAADDERSRQNVKARVMAQMSSDSPTAVLSHARQQAIFAEDAQNSDLLSAAACDLVAECAEWGSALTARIYDANMTLPLREIALRSTVHGTKIAAQYALAVMADSADATHLRYLVRLRVMQTFACSLATQDVRVVVRTIDALRRVMRHPTLRAAGWHNFCQLPGNGVEALNALFTNSSTPPTVREKARLCLDAYVRDDDDEEEQEEEGERVSEPGPSAGRKPSDVAKNDRAKFVEVLGEDDRDATSSVGSPQKREPAVRRSTATVEMDAKSRSEWTTLFGTPPRSSSSSSSSSSSPSSSAFSPLFTRGSDRKVERAMHDSGGGGATVREHGGGGGGDGQVDDEERDDQVEDDERDYGQEYIDQLVADDEDDTDGDDARPLPPHSSSSEVATTFGVGRRDGGAGGGRGGGGNSLSQFSFPPPRSPSSSAPSLFSFPSSSASSSSSSPFYYAPRSFPIAPEPAAAAAPPSPWETPTQDGGGRPPGLSPFFFSTSSSSSSSFALPSQSTSLSTPSSLFSARAFSPSSSSPSATRFSYV